MIQDPVAPYPLSFYPVGNLPFAGWYLEGEQCLVFFLGGIYYNGAPNGFSTNASNPVVGSDRVPPFFDFKSDRLFFVSGTAGYPSYQDPYHKIPYAYFSSYKNSNGYNRYVNISNPYIQPVPGSPITSDCQALSQYTATGSAVFPYCQSGMAYQTSPPGPLVGPPVYLNSQTYQVISAGKNLFFGNGTVVQAYPPQLGAPWVANPSTSAFPAGNSDWVTYPPNSPVPGLWTPSAAGQVYTQGDPTKNPQAGGYDDIANFYDRLLGVPTQ
jgi:hypothetical protein